METTDSKGRGEPYHFRFMTILLTLRVPSNFLKSDAWESFKAEYNGRKICRAYNRATAWTKYV